MRYGLVTLRQRRLNQIPGPLCLSFSSSLSRRLSIYPPIHLSISTAREDDGVVSIRRRVIRTHRSSSPRYLSTNKWLFLPPAQGCSRSAAACLHGAKEQRAFFVYTAFVLRDNGHSEAWKVRRSRRDEPQRKYFSTFLPTLWRARALPLFLFVFFPLSETFMPVADRENLPARANSCEIRPGRRARA